MQSKKISNTEAHRARRGVSRHRIVSYEQNKISVWVTLTFSVWAGGRVIGSTNILQRLRNMDDYDGKQDYLVVLDHILFNRVLFWHSIQVDLSVQSLTNILLILRHCTVPLQGCCFYTHIKYYILYKVMLDNLHHLQDGSLRYQCRLKTIKFTYFSHWTISLKILSSQKRGGYRGVPFDSSWPPAPSQIFFLNT